MSSGPGEAPRTSAKCCSVRRRSGVSAAMCCGTGVTVGGRWVGVSWIGVSWVGALLVGALLVGVAVHEVRQSAAASASAAQVLLVRTADSHLSVASPGRSVEQLLEEAASAALVAAVAVVA